jgi:hypothetical protein
MRVCAVDFESYYDDECNVRKLGIRKYLNHCKFDVYLVACVGDDGMEFIGDPRNFNWMWLSGVGVVSHNAVFDRAIYYFGVTNGWWVDVKFKFWYCTANLCTLRRVPRSLDNAVNYIYGFKLSKDVRDAMLGVKWVDLSHDQKVKVIAYARDDARMCLNLWFDLK